ncbi:MAG: ribonuclease Z [Candidatus Bilamarchaeaceae archaeon]
MLRVTFLGTSGSAPTKERGMPSIALQYEGDLMLFDIGEGTQRQMMKYGVSYGSVDTIFISHPHIDHYLGIFGLLETLTLSHTKKKIDVFGFADFEWIKDEYQFVNFKKMKKGILHEGSRYTISAFPVKHCKNAYGFIFQEKDKIKFYEEKAKEAGIRGKMFKEIEKKGYLIVNDKKVKLEDISWIKKGRKVVYSGDTLPQKETILFSKDADLLIHEGTFSQENEKEAKERLHTTMEDAAKIALKANVKKLVLTHFSPRYPDLSVFEERVKKIFKNTFFAYDGFVIDV